ncbi:ABC transporter ATP-binding protein [Corynebacterium freiburgense]|uniref:ABC transporter ATP-binding protein n=1 Tax=Corynebacterium freiburgense TaxID=556548 RepID=UPI000419A56F|nr:ABC transporter ATP-binding protein [Corynebacterium freiburgense]WJZ02238.1 Lipid A export ATP-binding/permease protein MsbA [Corynebacterium freiburgense]
MTTWQLLWRLSGSARNTTFGGVILRLLQSLFLGLAYSAALIVVIRLVSYEEITSADVRAICILCVMSLVGQLTCGYFASRCSWLGAYQAVAEMRLALLDHIRNVPIADISKTRRGDLANLLTIDLQAVEDFLSESFPRLGQAIGLPLAVSISIGFQDPVLGFSIAASIIAAIPVASWSGKRIGELSDERQQTQATATSQMIDTFTGMPVLRVLSTKEAVRHYFEQAVEKFRRISIVMVHRIVIPSVTTSLVVFLGVPFVLGVVGWRSLPNQEFVLSAVILLLVLNVYQPLIGVIGTAESWRLCEASLRRIDKVLQISTQPQSQTNARKIQDYSIQLDNVCYTYPDGTQALKDISFTVQSGDMLAIVGLSGAGKSTVLHLISRLNDATDGTIRIGGVDIREIPQEQLFDLISVVFQEVHLFPGTVAENIAIAKPSATIEEIIAAAKAAYAHEFIQELPRGYETIIGEDGAGLSGGQRQRLSIARALLKDAPIVLLDEATSAVDPGAELAINKGLSALLTGRTVIVVAHQLATITAANQILVMDHGSVAEVGTHTELLAQRGVYTHLWERLSKARKWQL